jgi:hypothetical protein
MLSLSRGARIAALALIFSARMAAAQNAPAEKPPQPESGTGLQIACISEDDKFTAIRDKPGFAITLQNLCERRMQCEVFAYITTAKGPTQAHGRLLLAPKSRGDAAKATYAVRVKMMGGNTTSTRECRAL